MTVRPHPPLELRGLRKSFGDRVIFDGLDLTLQAGQIARLLGPNGSGKTTLLSCIAGTLIPDEGTILIDGHDLHDAPLEARRRLRFLAQRDTPPLGLSGDELVAFHAEVLGASPEALQGARERAGLGAALSHLASTYSVGMFRRLQLACLALGDPRLVVLDEPFAGLDLEAQEALRRQILSWVDEGVALILATHTEGLGTLLAREIVDIACLEPVT